MRDPLKAPDGGRGDRIERADGPGRDAQASTSGARGRAQLLLDRGIGERADAHRDEVEPRPQHDRPMGTERLVSGDLDHHVRPELEQRREIADDGRAIGSRPGGIAYQRADDVDLAWEALAGDADDRASDGAEPDQPDALRHPAAGSAPGPRTRRYPTQK